MQGVKQIEKAVEMLSPEELKEFRKWFAEFDNRNWEQKIENDVKSGRLNNVVREALTEYKKGESQEM